MLYGTQEWFVVRTKPRREEYAQDQLTRRGVDTFLPRILEPGRAAGEPVVGPLFPGYLFASMDPVNFAVHATTLMFAVTV